MKLFSPFFVFVFCILLIIPSSHSWRRRRRRRGPPDNPPRFVDCPGARIIQVAAIPTTVTWPDPHALDDTGPPSITRSGPASGSSFGKGRHSIIYTVRDPAGHTSTCIIIFTVVKRVRRSAVKVTVQINLPGLTCDSDEDQLEAQDNLALQLQKWRTEIPCLYEELCTISDIVVSQCYPRTYYTKLPHNRKSVATATIALVRNINNIETDDAESQGDIDQRLQESVDTIKQLVTKHGLDIGWPDKMLIKDNSTIFVDGWDLCPPGTIESHHAHFCYPCSQGSYRSYDSNQDDFECQPCPLNSYQDEDSSEMCKPCPNGQTTLKTGSTSLTDCLGEFEYSYWNNLDGETFNIQLHGWRIIGVALMGLLIVSASVFVFTRFLCRKSGQKKLDVST